MCNSPGSSMVRWTARCLFDAKPSTKPMLKLRAGLCANLTLFQNKSHWDLLVMTWKIKNVTRMSLTLSQCTQADPVYTGIPLVDPVYTGIPRGDPASTCRVHWGTTRKTYLKLPHTGMPLEKLWLFLPALEHHCRDCNIPHTPMHMYLNRVAPIPVSNDKTAGQQAASGQVSVKSAFNWSLLFCNGYPFCSSNTWVLQHHFVHALDMSTIIVFVYLGLQFKRNKLSSNKSRHTSSVHKGLVACWEVTWPNDHQTRFYQYTGIPLDRLHWNHTGRCYHPVVFQWQPNVS